MRWFSLGPGDVLRNRVHLNNIINGLCGGKSYLKIAFEHGAEVLTTNLITDSSSPVFWGIL